MGPLIGGQADLTRDDGGEHASRRQRAGQWRGCGRDHADADRNHGGVDHGVTESEEGAGDVVGCLVVSTMGGPRVDGQPGDLPWASMQNMSVQRPLDERLSHDHRPDANRVLQPDRAESRPDGGGQRDRQRQHIRRGVTGELPSHRPFRRQ